MDDGHLGYIKKFIDQNTGMQNTKFTMRIDDFWILQDSCVQGQMWPRIFLYKHDSKIKAKSTCLSELYMVASLDKWLLCV
jgi:hypothetical protein